MFQHNPLLGNRRGSIPDDNLQRWTIRTPELLRDLVEVINETGLGSVFVEDSEGRVVALVTDGDVRRALLAGFGLTSPAHHAYNESFAKLTDGSDASAVLRAAKKRKLPFLPVVDREGRLLSVERLSFPLPKPSHNNIVVIMAGGKGSRLGALTSNTPKPLLEVDGKPIAQHIVEKLREDGFTRLYLAIHYLGAQIEDFFGDGSQFGVEIRYLKENMPLGTAGALALLPESEKSPVVVVNGDLVLGMSISKMLEYHVSSGADVTIGSKVVETTVPYGVLSTRNGLVLGIAEKPTYRDFVNAGLYVLSRNVVERIQRDSVIDMPDVLEQAIESGRVLAYPIHEEWADLGTPASLESRRQNRDQLSGLQ